MTIQIRDSNPRNVTPQPLLGEPILTNLEQLKIPDEVALRPENVGPYLAGQAHHLHEIENRPDYRAGEAELPEYMEPQSGPALSTLSTQEQEALISWSEENFGVHTASFNPDNLISQIDQLVASQPQHTGPASGIEPDFLGNIAINNQINETREMREKWLTAIANAKGDPESVALILGMRAQAQHIRKSKVLLEAYNHKVQQRERVLAQMDLSSGTGRAAPSAADVSRMNAQSNSVGMDLGLILQQLQSVVADMNVNSERTHNFIRKVNEDFKQIQQNMLPR